MGILKRHGEKITPDFIEDEFISAIETCLNRYFYYDGKYVEIRRISQADENELGYDGVLTTIVPFYIQFKRSDFYSPKFAGKLLKQREDVKLPVERGFFAFELLRKNGKYAQHNAMYLLSQRNRAAYVAPLFYKSNDLTNYRLQSAPTYYGDTVTYDFLTNRTYGFRNLFFFRKAVTIKPHDIISDNNSSHHYSYCRDCQIGFHSDPINVESNKIQYLSDFVEDIFKQEKSQEIKQLAIDNFNLLPKFFDLEAGSEEFNSILWNSIKRISIVDDDSNITAIIKELDIIDKLAVTEDILNHYFNIRQFIKFEHN